VRLVGQKRIQVEPLISHSLPLDDVQKGFDLHTEKVPGTMKVLLKP
jgi:threonine dehydrogenase-like Zn-dependent dehydrogenase